MGTNREEKALLEFKHIMNDLIQLLGRSVGAKTAYLYWVNRSRKQFVLECSYSNLSDVMFKDRIGFEKFFLDRFKDQEELLTLEVGKDVTQDDLVHYYKAVPVNHLTLIPFKNNGSTVALTVLESDTAADSGEGDKAIASYRDAHINVLNTYLELTDLYESQKMWADFDQAAEKISPRLDKTEIVDLMAKEMVKLLPSGGVTVALRGMETWVTVLNRSSGNRQADTGLMVQEKSMVYETLQRGKDLFSMHFNSNPKRISGEEKHTEGATLAIPMMMSEKRCAAVLAYDKSPLTFNEAVKHQLKNLARVATLSIQANEEPKADQNLFTTEYGNFIPEIMDLCLQIESEHLAVDSRREVWYGLIGIDNLSELRSRFRLDDLKQLQRIMVKALNPSRMGMKGIVGSHSDYVYSYIFIGEQSSQHEQWLQKLSEDLRSHVDMGDGRTVRIDILSGSGKLKGAISDPQQIWRNAKNRMSGASGNLNASTG
jgi:hypothetical protein